MDTFKKKKKESPVSLAGTQDAQLKSETRVGDKTRKTQGPNNLQWDGEPPANFFYRWPNKYFQPYAPNSLF